MRCPWRKGLASPNERAPQRCEPLLRPEPAHPTAEGFSSFGAGTPVQPDATHGEDTIENRARGREAANDAASTDDIDIRHAAVDCDAARPRALPRMAFPSDPRGAQPARSAAARHKDPPTFRPQQSGETFIVLLIAGRMSAQAPEMSENDVALARPT